jgi:uncharacterized iron-regulated membrane protein
MKETEQVDLANASAPARSGEGAKRAWGAALYTAIWRWHFWAGLCVTPILLVVSITGLLYVFKEELEPLIYPQLVQVLPEERSAPIADQIAAARPYADGWKIAYYARAEDPNRSAQLFLERESPDGKEVYRWVFTCHGRLACPDGLKPVPLRAKKPALP